MKQFWKKTLWAALLTAAFALSATGCGDDKQPASSTANSASSAAQAADSSTAPEETDSSAETNVFQYEMNDDGTVTVDQEDADLLKSMNLCHHAIVGSATNPTEVLEKSLAVNGGKEYDVSILIVNVPACEMAAILPVRDNGTVYFFSMATDFAKAALGAEGCGKDVTMIVGNGYTKDHAEITLSELRENAQLKEYFEKKYL